MHITYGQIYNCIATIRLAEFEPKSSALKADDHWSKSYKRYITTTYRVVVVGWNVF
jgi:hypothetical protein